MHHAANIVRLQEGKRENSVGGGRDTIMLGSSASGGGQALAHWIQLSPRDRDRSLFLC